MVEFWLNDVDALWKHGAWRNFVPMVGEPLNAVLNSTARFAIVLGVTLSVYHQNWSWFIYLTLPCIVLTIVAYKYFGDDNGMIDVKQRQKIVVARDIYDEEDSDLVARPEVRLKMEPKRLVPTFDNPYANPNPTDLQAGMLVLPPKDPTDIRVQAAIHAAGSDGILSDDRDMWGKNDAGGLTFFTVAGAPYGDPLGEFRAFLTKDIDKPTRKEMHSNFGPVYRDLRHVPKRIPYPYLPEN